MLAIIPDRRIERAHSVALRVRAVPYPAINNWYAKDSPTTVVFRQMFSIHDEIHFDLQRMPRSMAAGAYPVHEVKVYCGQKRVAIGQSIDKLAVVTKFRPELAKAHLDRSSPTHKSIITLIFSPILLLDADKASLQKTPNIHSVPARGILYPIASGILA
ncbi:hypothetical protein BS47DRAFT_1400017 [Hydnum rufescens UP504]|uniref:Uncharacterized protein n=1 Tax=Hydnum rufescens UP504 TaxID=1448309 RepID=A0A9P6DP29_9AGAM|nr:hypothetical protein BS47DRAFT_1400017 [Hydnum rufescens UP504]